jgi:hypothetical protein
MFETSIPQENFDRIDRIIRNNLQKELMILSIPDMNDKTELAWIEKYGKKVSDIIDDNRNTAIRSAILEDKDINRAVLLIRDILEKESQDSEMQKAA